jgi:protocatechuate 3,4-dioxygenase beta subunit
MTHSSNRRSFLGMAAKGAASIFVSQSLFACSADGLTGSADESTSVTPGSANATCVGTAALTEGPYFVDEKLLRSDIRTDPSNGVVSSGIPLTLQFNVQRISGNACTPLTGAYVDIWHCDAGGLYSDESANGTSGKKYLRGYQITDANGQVNFTTVYPGWYSGRAVHVHFKVRLYAGTTKSYEFTSQFFFDESLNSSVHGNSPYNTRGSRNTLNSTDGIYNGLTSAQKSALTLSTTPASTGYAGVVNIGVTVG